MILEKQTEALVLEEGQSSETIAMSLDLDSAQILMQMLSKNLYSDSIGSTVRECASNALDSHRRAGVVKPIIVAFKANSSNNYEFSVEDFGIGLDDEDVRNIISKYGKSTKRQSENELGMMGLGFKAPLAYSSSFYFVARKNGVERKYMMYEGEDTNTIDLLYTVETTESNGVKVIVPVKYSDKHDFIEKMQEQLAYFENVYFDSPFIDNKFEIYRNNLFQSSTLTTDNNMHICLDDVYYPIDFQKLGIDTIHSRIGLRFSLKDGIYPTPNRESIRYTKEAKDKILEKISEVADFFVEKYNAKISNTNNIVDIFKHYSSGDNYYNLTDRISININNISKFSKIPINKPEIANCKYLNSWQIYSKRTEIFSEYECKYHLNGSRLSKNRWVNCFDVHRLSNSANKYYIYSKNLSELKKAYIKYVQKGSSSYSNGVFLIKKTRTLPLINKSSTERYFSYYEILGLKNYPKNVWRDVIIEFQTLLKEFEKTFIVLDDLVIPQSFIDSRKKPHAAKAAKDKIQKIEGDISAKIADRLEKSVGDNNCKFVATVIKQETISNSKKMIIYGKHSDLALIDDLYGILPKVTFYTLSEREYEKIQNAKPPHWMSVTEFMKGDNKIFRRLMTAYEIYKLKSDYRSILKHSDFSKISLKLSNQMQILENYKHKSIMSNSSSKFEKVLSKLAEKAKVDNLYDHSVHYVCVNLRRDFEKLYFLNSILQNVGYWWKPSKEDGTTKAIIDLLKYHKYSWISK